MKEAKQEKQIKEPALVILQKDEKVLRLKAKKLTPADIKTPKIKKLIAGMKSALAREIDGVGIAAPQVGESLCIFVISELALESAHVKNKSGTPLVYINPEIVKASREKKILEEGCLSVRPLFGLVERANKVTVRAFDENGKVFERGGSGLLAQIFQHEIDHLNGELFIDKATDIHEMPMEDQVALEQGRKEHEQNS